MVEIEKADLQRAVERRLDLIELPRSFRAGVCFGAI